MSDTYRADVNISGIPTSVPRDKLVEAFESFGFNTNLINTLEIGPDAIYVKVTAYKPDGTAVTRNNERVQHTIIVPLLD